MGKGGDVIESICERLAGAKTLTKTVLCPSGAAGYLLLRAVLGRVPGVINLQCRTIEDFVSRSMGFWLIEKGIKPLKSGHAILLLQDLIEPGGSFAVMRAMPGFQEALLNAVYELRLERINPAALTQETLGDAGKARELVALLKAYEAALKERRLIDYPGLLQRGIFERRLEAGTDLVFLPGSLPLRPLEREFLEQAGDRLIHLPYAAPADLPIPESWRREGRRPAFTGLEQGAGEGTEKDPGISVTADLKAGQKHAAKPVSEAERVQTSDTSGSDSSSEPGSEAGLLPPGAAVSLFAAIDPTAEIREILRRIAAARVPFEQIAVVVANPAEYAALAASLFETAGVPLALGTARAPDEFRPGRLALNLCDWAANGFPVEGLIAMLNQGDLRLFPGRAGAKSGAARPPGTPRLISLLRQSHVRGGRDGYEPPLRACGEAARARGNRRLSGQCRRVIRRLGTLLEGFPESASPGELAMGFRELLGRFTRVAGEADLKRLARLRSALAGYRLLDKPALPLAEGMRWVARIIRQVSAQESFRPDGRVLLTTPEAAPFAERPVLFYPGLTHGAVPGSPSPDPIIADVFRRRLPPLKTAEQARFEGLARLAAGWASLPNAREITLSLPLTDTSGRAVSPASPFLQVLASRIPGGSEFTGVLNTPALPLIGPFADPGDRGDSPGPAALDFREWLQQAKAQGMPEDVQRSLVQSLFPGYLAYDLRQFDRAQESAAVATGLPHWDAAAWTRYNHPDRAISASGIETYAGCRYAVFLSQVLGCMPAEKLDTQPLATDGWLDNLQRGNFLHELYESFLRQAGWPVTDACRPLMERLLDEIAARYRALIPPPNPSVSARETENLRRDAFAFLDFEIKRGRGPARPVGFELSFGMPKTSCASNDTASADDDTPPVGTSEPAARSAASEPLKPSEAVPGQERSSLGTSLSTHSDAALRPSASGAAAPPESPALDGLEFPDPVPFSLPDGRALYLKGRIDRIDRTPAGLEIWDYKTGIVDSYAEGGPKHDQGFLQVALYKYALARLLQERGHPESVTAAGLSFPTRSGRGKRLLLQGDLEKTVLHQRLSELVDFLEAGEFPASDSCSECPAEFLCPFAPLVHVVENKDGATASAAGKEPKP